MQAVVGQLLPQYVRSLFDETREKVDVRNLLFFCQRAQLGIDGGNRVRLSRHSLVASETFVYGQKALQVEFCAGRLPADALYRHANHAGNAVGGQIVRYIVYTDERSEEHTSELQSRQYLVCRLLLEKKN